MTKPILSNCYDKLSYMRTLNIIYFCMFFSQ